MEIRKKLLKELQMYENGRKNQENKNIRKKVVESIVKVIEVETEE